MKLVGEALVDFKKNADGFPSTLEPMKQCYHLDDICS
jgi:hypothetical protein